MKDKCKDQLSFTELIGSVNFIEVFVVIVDVLYMYLINIVTS